MPQLIFHGSKAAINSFNKTISDHTEGYIFYSNLKAANQQAIRSSSTGEPSIYVCTIADDFISYYPSGGFSIVPFTHADRVTILEVLPCNDLPEEVLTDSNSPYLCGTKDNLGNTEIVSYLRCA